MGRKYLILFILISICGSLLAQNDKLPISVRGEVKLPVALSNKPLKTYMDEIAVLDVSAQFPVFYDFYIGLGVNYLFGKVDVIILPNYSNANFQFFTPYLNLGMEKSVSENGFVNFGIKSGYALMNFKGDVCVNNFNKPPYKESAFFVEPQAGYYLKVEEKFVFGLIVSVSNYFHEFSPERICLNEFDEDVLQMDAKGITQFFNVGFGFSVFLTSED